VLLRRSAFKVRREKITGILSEIMYILNKNPNLLSDIEVTKWIITIYGIAMVYGDSRIRKFFKDIGAKLLQQPNY